MIQFREKKIRTKKNKIRTRIRHCVLLRCADTVCRKREG